MDTTWADGQIVLEYYQACLAVLVWLLATFACLGILASVVLVFLECNPFTRSADHALKPPSERGARG